MNADQVSNHLELANGHVMCYGVITTVGNLTNQNPTKEKYYDYKVT